jgi:PAS domain S-box-containing protein
MKLYRIKDSKLKLKFPILLILLLLIFLVFLGGFKLYENEKKSVYLEKSADLRTIAELKISELVHWKKERIGDAQVISHLPVLINYLNNIKHDDFDSLFSDIVRVYDYDAIFLSSPEGKLLYGIGSEITEFDKETQLKIQASRKENTIKVTDFYHCSLEEKIHYDIIAPVRNYNKKVVSYIIFRTNPNDFIYPFIQSWPTNSKTAETLLLREYNDSVMFLNELRHIENSALKLKIPLTQIDVPAVQAVKGYTGILEGTDYRGVHVLAYVSPVLNSNWFMVSKVDYDEIFVDLKFKLAAIGISSFLVIILLVAILAFFYNSRQKNIFRTLYETQEEFKTILYSIGDAVITTDSIGKIKQLNNVAERLTGWKESEARNKNIETVLNIINENTRIKVESPYTKVIETGDIVGLKNHTLLITKHGKEIPISDSGAPIKNDKQELIGTIMVFRDQTDERITQKLTHIKITLLELSKEHTSKVLLQKALELVISFFNTDTGFIYIVDSQELIIENEEITVLSDNIIPKCIETKTAVKNAYHLNTNNKSTKTKKYHEIAFPIIKLGNVVAIINIQGKPCEFSDKEIQSIGNMCEMIWDIYEGKYNQELYEEEQRLLNDLINTIPDSIYFKDLNLNYFRINHALAEKFGVENSESIIGMRNKDFFEEKYAMQSDKHEKQIIETGEPLINFEEEQTWKNGETTWTFASKIPLRNSNGEINGIMGISKDITDRKTMEKELVYAKRKAEESDKLKSAFLANMSHEIRTPLNGILGFTNIILEKDKIPVNEKIRYRNIIQKSSESLLQVINDILDISRIESGDLQIEIKPCDIKKTLRNLQTIYLSKIKEENKDIKLNLLKHDSKKIYTDEKRLQQVFTNLLDNAIKFTFQGEINFGIEKIKNNTISFFVSDTGIGIADDKHEIIFDRFRQIENNNLETGGNGLGLSIVKNIIELLSGKIWIDTSYRKGSMFRFEIPYHIDEENLTDTSEPFTLNLRTNRQIQVLLVEDDMVNQQYIIELLKNKNCKIYAVSKGKEALEIIMRKKIDIVLMDVKLPDISGLKITKGIRKIKPDVYIIAQTAYTMQSNEHEAIKSGCNEFISKPVLPEKLFEAINKGLKMSQKNLMINY